jgi:RNA polymerase sigma-70 factor (ECF subfamily)
MDGTGTAGDSGQGVRQMVEHLFRHQSARILAGLCRAFGLEHLELAEEVVQDALLQALRQWPFHGVPDNPAAWLTRVARNRALDALRRRAAFRERLPQLERLLRERPPAGPAQPDDALADDQLGMIFACCHLAIPAEARVALTLKAVGGFSTAEVARAFLAPETTVAQRLVRAKRRIEEEHVTLALPGPDELPGRLDSVLRVLYLLFNEGYAAHQGEDLVRQDLCGEAIRLGRLLAAHPDTGRPEVHALLALMLLQSSRLPTRVDDRGELLLLAEQDRSQWDRGLIALGLRHLGQSAEGDRLTEYHVQAAIAATHAAAPRYEDTDWAYLVALYDQLHELTPSPVVALNRAVALSMARGPEAGLQALGELRDDPALRHYYLLPAARADMLLRLGRRGEAAAAYRAALAAPCSEPERRFLLRKLAACEGPAVTAAPPGP